MQASHTQKASDIGNSHSPQTKVDIDPNNTFLNNEYCVFAQKNYESCLIRQGTLKISEEKQKLLKEAQFSRDEIVKRLSTSNRIEIAVMKNLIKLAKVSICNDNLPIEIIPGIFIGSIGAACNKESLLQHKITNIISCQDIDFRPFRTEFAYKNVDVQDHATQDISNHFDETNNYIDLAQKADKNAKFQIHCFAGKSRSATVLCAYLMYKQNIRFEEAIRQVRSRRERAKPNDGFMYQLSVFERNLRQH